ncbi:sortase [candidate division WWE3 bacterium]|nr:sortase [candidate division WWE3 bacterium]
MFKKKVYIKDESFDPIYKARSKNFMLKSRLIPVTLILGGLSLLGSQVVFPLVYFTTQEDKVQTQQAKKVESSVLGAVSGFKDFEFEELSEEGVDTGVAEESPKDLPKFFTLSIPALGIEDALVEVNAASLDPKEALGHYPGSGLPGETGNSFIFGHSVLPWFFNPKNYKTIFSTLDQLKVGDEIFIEFNGARLTYRVETSEILYPDQVAPLKEVKPDFLNESTITLMTCVPPGTKMKRLLVHAVLE